MWVEETNHDPRGPWVIKNLNGEELYCSYEDLEDLMFTLERITKEEQAKGKMQIAVKVVMG